MNQSIRRIPVLMALAALAAAILASPASAALFPDSPREDLPTKEESIVPGHYIVVFKDSVDKPGNLARAQTEQQGGELGFVYRHALKGYSAELSKSDVEALRKDSRVDYITPDHIVEAAGQSTPTGVNRAFAAANEELDIDEVDDVRVDADVAVLDTGVDYKHPDLDVVERTDCVSPGGLEKPEAPGECVDNTGSDSNGHGTHVAGTIGAIDNDYGVVGVAPGARIWGVKVLTAFGGYESWIVAGVDWVTDHAEEIEVANMSLSCGPIFDEKTGTWSTPCTMKAMETAISASVEAGVVYVVAAGNKSVDAGKYVSPAKHPDVITVSAMADYDGFIGEKSEPLSYEDPSCENPTEENWKEQTEEEWDHFGPDDGTATFSNYGKVVDVAAPGVCILSTMSANLGGGETLTYYTKFSGTSMASPHVAGAAAVLASESNPDSKEDVEAIHKAIEDEGKAAEEAGISNWYGGDFYDAVLEPLLYAGGDAGVPLPSLVRAFGSEGAESGEFALPEGIATDPEGNVWVADLFNHRIQQFDSAGKFIRKVGSKGSGDGQFLFPCGITTDSKGNVWVADPGNYRIQKFDPEGKFIRKVGVKGPGDGQFINPNGITTDSKGNVWVTDASRIQQFDSEGNFVRKVGVNGTGEGQFKSPRGITIDSEGNIWVADTGNNRIQKLDPEGKYISQFGTTGTGHKQLDFPTDAAVDAEGNIWVADTENNRIQEFNSKGEYLSQLGTQAGSMQLNRPHGVEIGANGHLWIADTDNSRVQEWIPAPAPKATTEAASALESTGATLRAKVNPEGSGTRYQFEYGTTTAYGQTAPVSPQYIGAGTKEVEASEKVESLKPGTTYHFRVKATSQTRTAYGKDLTFTTAPQTAVTEAASGVKATEATLNGTVNPKGASTSYQFEYGTTTAYGTKAPISAKSVGSGSSDVKVAEAISGLKQLTTYHFRVVATSAAGTVYGKDLTFTTLALPTAKTETASGVKPSEAVLNGLVNPKGTSTSYQFEYGLTTSYGTKAPISAKSIGSGSSDVKVAEAINGLQGGTTYHFRVVATSEAGTVKGEDLTFTTPGPTASTETAYGVRSTDATLRGSVNPNGLSTTYQFEYGTTISYGTKVPLTAKSVGSGKTAVKVSEKITNLKSGTTYHFRVVATSSNGTAYGADQTFTTSTWLIEGKTLSALGISSESFKGEGGPFAVSGGGLKLLSCGKLLIQGSILSSGAGSGKMTLTECKLTAEAEYANCKLVEKSLVSTPQFTVKPSENGNYLVFGAYIYITIERINPNEECLLINSFAKSEKLPISGEFAGDLGPEAAEPSLAFSPSIDKAATDGGFSEGLHVGIWGMSQSYLEEGQASLVLTGAKAGKPWGAS